MFRPSRRPAARSATRDGARQRSTCRRFRPSWMRVLSPPRKSKLSTNNSEFKYVIGINLCTTNSALAYAEIVADADPFAPAIVRIMALPQLTNPGEVRDEDLLPSFLYLPGSGDFPQGSTALPWDGNRDLVVGRLAQKRGVENAG